MNTYWHIELYSGEIIKVKPDDQKIKFIQDKIAKQEGAITTPTRSIVVKDIKDFRLSDEIFTDQKLIQDTARALDEPVMTENGVKASWVKKSVPRRRWDSHYRFIPAYKLIGENESYVIIAFRLPVHEINPISVEELTAYEILQLNTA